MRQAAAGPRTRTPSRRAVNHAATPAPGRAAAAFATLGPDSRRARASRFVAAPDPGRYARNRCDGELDSDLSLYGNFARPVLCLSRAAYPAFARAPTPSGP